jgi:CDP-diacylglycerol--glycerol-3-phosphate 3-phosphatidyltransferase
VLWNTPNLLTLLRIFLIPVFIAAYYLPFRWAPQLATALFVLAALTDWLDGYLARRWGETSAFGAFLDPVADKLMVAAALVLIVDTNPTGLSGIWIALPSVVIVGREIAVSALREHMAELGARAKVAVSMMGKIKTTTQMIALLLLIYQMPIGPLPTVSIGVIMLYIAAALTLWSMVLYLKAAIPVLTEQQHSKNG